MPSPVRKIISSSPKVTLILATTGAAVLLIVTAVIFYQSRAPRVTTINYSELYQIAETGSATALSIESDALIVRNKQGALLQATVTSEAIRQGVVEQFRKNNVPIEFRPIEASWTATALTWGAPLTVVLLLALIGWRVHANMGGGVGSFKLTNQSGKQNVSFADVAGVDEASAEMTETIEFLRDPARFGRLGGRAPRGILLYGPPGTGKTLMARAVAGEADVPFLLASGSSFQEKFAGVGAARVRRLFAEGKKVSPCIIFIDEIDALGRQRGRGNDSASADQDQTLNQLLIEMDGFDQSSSVVVIGSTNRPDVLDRALTRPGRFDREIAVNLPDVRGREAILRVHARKMELDSQLDLSWVARGTPGFSGADLENLVNEAALWAARLNKKEVAFVDFEMAKDKVLMGAERKSLILSDEEKRTTAYHEAGHALIAKLIPGTDPVHKVTIIPRGRALGLTMQLPTDDRHGYSKVYLYNQLAILMGGRVAEELVLKDMTTGAGNDLERATDLARKMVCEWGMSEKMGPLTFGKQNEQVFLGRELGSQRDFSDQIAMEIDEEVKRLVMENYERAKRLLTENMVTLKRLAEALLEKEVLDSADIDNILMQPTSQAVPA